MFLFPHHQLCVTQDFQFAGTSSNSLLPIGRYFWSKSPLLSLLGFIFRFYIYHCHHSIQHHFLSITSLFLVVSLLPGCAKFISFFLFVCARIKSFPLLFYSSYVSSN